MNEIKNPADSGASLSDAGLERAEGAVWSYLNYRHWALIAEDGELLAEIKGEHPPGVYGYKGRRYASDTQAKVAVMRDLRPNGQS